MTPDEKAESARQLIYIQSTLRLLRDHIDLTARRAKAIGSLGLSFAAFHLSESIAAYAIEVTKFIAEDLTDGKTEDGSEED